MRGRWSTPRPVRFTPRLNTHFIAGWVGSRSSLDGCGKSRPHWGSIGGPSCPVSESQHRLRYLGPPLLSLVLQLQMDLLYQPIMIGGYGALEEWWLVGKSQSAWIITCSSNTLFIHIAQGLHWEWIRASGLTHWGRVHLNCLNARYRGF